MAFSTQRAVSNGTMALLAVSIGYIKQADIAVFYNNLPAAAGTWAWVGNTSQIAFTPAVPAGVEVLLKRTTQIDKVINRFAAGAGFTNQSMDTDFTQMLYLNQEAVEGAALTDIFNNVDFHGYRPTNIGLAVNPNDAVSLAQYQADALGAFTHKQTAQAAAAAALVSELASAGHASAALASKNAAATSEGTATAAAGTATAQANTAAAQASIATTQATAAAASYDAFDDRYLGAKASAPALDNDGNALLTGALYWDTTLSSMRSYNGSAWVTLPAATAAATANVPAGNINATDVQAAITELDSEKVAKSGDTMTGNLVVPTVNGVALLHRNDIINGNFPVAQAGTSFAAPASGAYDLDGWLNTNNATAAVFTVAQVAGSTAGRRARQVTVTTADTAVAAGDLVSDETRIEGYNIEKYVGNTFTIAFRAKVPVVGIHCVSLRNIAGVDRSYVKEINFPTANVWQDCSFTVTGGLPTAGTWNYTNGVGLMLGFTRMAGTAWHTAPDAWQTGNFQATANQVNDCATVGNVWALEKVTLNLGTVAAVGEISYEDELRRCQRYYEKSFEDGQPPVNGETDFATLVGISVGMGTNRQSVGTSIAFAVPKRGPPSFDLYGNSAKQWAWIAENGTARAFSASVGPANLSRNGFTISQQVVDGSSVFVMGHWAASARL